MTYKVLDVWGQEVTPGTLIRYSTDARIIRYGIYLGTVTTTKTKKYGGTIPHHSWQETQFLVAGNNSVSYNAVRWKCNLSKLRYVPDCSLEVVQDIVSPSADYTKMLADLKTFADEQMLKFAGKLDP